MMLPEADVPDISLGLEIVGEGLLFPEGPIAMSDGSVLLVEIARGTLSRVVDGRIRMIAELGGGPNGAAIGPDGAVYVCNNGGRFEFVERQGRLFPGPRPERHLGGSIQRIDLADGAIETLYVECGGRPLLAPNDLVFDRSGNFWFTDHGTGHADGAIFYAAADGSGITCCREGLPAPNGIGLSPDGSHLIVANTRPAFISAYRIQSPGTLANTSEEQAVLARLPEDHWADSLAVETDGRVCVGTLNVGGITICSSDGRSEYVPLPDAMTTNICFGGEDMRDAYVTLSSLGRLGRLRWPRAGLRLNDSI